MLLHLQKYQINRQLRQQSTRAMTMIELLVVITIIMLLTGVMIPTIRYQNRNRALREAERQLNAFIGSAQARAQQLGRPVGVWIERVNDGDPIVSANHSVSVYLAEVPLPYSGNLRNSFVRISSTGVLNFYLPTPRNNPDGTPIYDPSGMREYEADPILHHPNNHLIKDGDSFKIQFNYRGPYYDAVRNGNNYQLRNNQRHGRLNFANLSNSSGVPYQIHRLPKKSFLPPLNLPAGAVIDLSVSGTMAGQNEFLTTTDPPNRRPVILMFNPSGGVATIWNKGIQSQPMGWIHLLVGRQNQVSPTNIILDDETEKGNVEDMNNRWVSIDHRTGSIVSENVDSIAGSSYSDPENIAAARLLVRSGTGSEGN
ncbi:MAG: type II secretion system protein [Planctomycetaceae bacterium]|jgi:type II secretory pathway pseudopilin PulG|nr:type II secretion system protein [Planctomycetaceae bacterium]